MSEQPKSFPALELLIDALGVQSHITNEQFTILHQARTELKAAEELLRLSKILASEISSPEFDAAIEACERKP